ncbi:recombination protein RecR [Bathymodiolus platifrons methanotrophic gill symbiont]|uniref:recombination mediator RecR n=1 Tax=Bathymodiolus platifrons methanotrophic gill symbiont TaxID=113268 RepID=UPI000B419C2A|nr:recombination mediator RecR [Bathymodiolus platifrons methanotrophic gill symbiont]GAW85449.1 recombination protein RecR [Bathymodiolus platifrons methanotrophic gill symbiont]GFO76679.1 recombination protein RecR [Bathymodiolus platifrons methanotrophic gill symbiont]
MLKQELLSEVIDALCCMPGVGPKSAQRIALHLFQRDRGGAENLAKVLQVAVEKLGLCKKCRTLSEHELCELCANSERDQQVLCVVESPADVWLINQATDFKGIFFVLNGRLSPLDGIGPDEIGLDQLEQQLENTQITELILATNSTVEGEATAHFIAQLALPYKIKVSRIAHGVPVGGELEFIDSSTLAHAFSGRRDIA